LNKKPLKINQFNVFEKGLLKFSLIPSVPFLFFSEIDFVVKFDLQKKLKKILEIGRRNLQKKE